MSVDLFEHDLSLWRTDDPEWMRARKQEWLMVRHRLSLADFSLTEDMLQKIERYFIFGDTQFPGVDFYGFGSLGEDADDNLRGNLNSVVLQLWLFPEEIESRTVFLNQRYRFKFHWSRMEFRRGLYNVVRRELAPSEIGSYGVMGGREKSIMDFLNPKLDHFEEFQFGEHVRAPACLHPSGVFEWCVGDSAVELAYYESSRGAKKRDRGIHRSSPYIPFCLGTYLWDHLDYAIQHYPEDLHDASMRKHPERAKRPEYKKIVIRRERALQSVIQQVLLLRDEPRDSEVWSRPASEALASKLLDRYEERSFGDALLERWDEAARTSPKR